MIENYKKDRIERRSETKLQPKRITKLALFFLAFLAFSITTYAQPGAIDPTFNPTDIGFDTGDGANNYVNATALQSDGKIIIGGAFTSYNVTARNRVARLNADGTLDATFNPGSGANDWISSIAIQSDGKIIIGGAFTSYNGTARNHVARLNADGTLDASFNPGSGADNIVWSIALQSDGKIIIGGGFTTYNGTARSRIARLNTDGTLDATFNTGSGTDNNVYSIALQSDGKIIIGGWFTTYNGTARNNIARLNADGTLDATFNPGAGADNNVNSIALQSDGKIIIGGLFYSYNGKARKRIARVNTDGTLDTTFNPGSGANDWISSIAIQSDGKIIIGGLFSSYNGTARKHIARLNTDGTLDTTFNPGTGTNDYVYSVVLKSDGKIIIGGLFTTYNGTLSLYFALLNTDGTIILPVNPSTGANSSVNSIARQSDGKIIIGGNFLAYNGTARNYIARLNADGTLDNTFNPGTGTNTSIMSVALQSDGKIIIGGWFSSFNGTARNSIARLNADGTLDATFNPGTGANQAIRSITLQSDGKMIIGGNFTTYNGTARSRIARLNADGTLDTSFDPGTGTNTSIMSVALQSDGKIIIGGGFTSYNATASNYIARLNADGTLDATFNPGAGANSYVNSIALQSDGKIIIGGGFTSYNATARSRIARLNANGTLDATFNPGAGANSYVNSIALQSDGKIIIGGGFTSYNGTARSRIARLNADGTLDTSFNTGTGANNTVNSMVLQSDEKIIIGGDFTAYNGTGRNRVARIKGGECETASAASSMPSVLISTAITTITHTTTGATGIGAATNLPLGVTASWVAGTISISGSPSVLGLFNYSIPLLGICGTESATGTITVLPAAPIAVDGTYTYDGTVKTASATPAANTSIVWYAAATGSTLAAAPSNKNKGVYTSYAASKHLASGVESAARTLVTLTINALPITVTVNAGQNKVYGAVNPAFTYTPSTALVGGDNFTGSLTRTIGENVGSYAINQGSLALSTNYNISFVGANFSVTAKPITVTVNAGQNKVYGTANPTYTYTPSTALVGGDSFSGSLTRTVGENVGSYAITQGSLALSTNYNLSFVGANFSVTAKPVTVTVNAGQNKVYGAANPTYTYTPSTALVGGDNFTGSLSRDAGENVGSYAITQGSLALSTNYNTSFVGASFSVTAKPITVTVNTGQNKVYGAANPTYTYTPSTALVSGDSFSGSLTRNAGENVGSYAITQGSLALSTNYNLSFVGDDFSITKATPTIIMWPTANGITYGETLSVATLSGGSGSTTGSFGYTNGTVTPNAGTSNYTVDFTPTDAANFNTVSGNVSVSIAKATLSVTADDKIKKVGEVNPTFTITTTGFVLGDDATDLSALPQANCLAVVNSPVGDYEITVSGGSSANYNFNYVSGNLKIETATSIVSNNQITSSVWPNPTQGNLFISTNLVGKPYNVFDLTGSSVLTGSTIESMIDLNGLKPGIYMVNIDGTIFKVVKK